MINVTEPELLVSCGGGGEAGQGLLGLPLVLPAPVYKINKTRIFQPNLCFNDDF